MPRKYGFNDRLGLRAVASTLDTFYYPQDGPARRGRRYHFTRLAYENETSSPTEVKVGIKRGDLVIPLEENRSVSAGHTHAVTDEIVIHEGEQLQIYFNGASSGDSLIASICGYWVDMFENQ